MESYDKFATSVGRVPAFTADRPLVSQDVSQAGVDHLAFSILHGTFKVDAPGGCFCPLCSTIKLRMDEMCREEAARFYDEHYPPPGGFL